MLPLEIWQAIFISGCLFDGFRQVGCDLGNMFLRCFNGLLRIAAHLIDAMICTRDRGFSIATTFSEPSGAFFVMVSINYLPWSGLQQLALRRTWCTPLS